MYATYLWATNRQIDNIFKVVECLISALIHDLAIFILLIRIKHDCSYTVLKVIEWTVNNGQWGTIKYEICAIFKQKVIWPAFGKEI